MALPGLRDTNMLKDVVTAIAKDYLEEKSVTLPNAGAGLQVTVTVNGNGLAAEIKGVAQADLGNIDMGDFTKEVIARSTKWFLHALTLPAAINSTESASSFEHDVLAGINAGFNPPAAGLVLVIKVPAFDDPKVMGAAPSMHLSFGAKAKVAGGAKGAAGASASVKVAVPTPTATVSATATTDDSTPGKKKKGDTGKKPAPKPDDKDKKKDKK